MSGLEQFVDRRPRPLWLELKGERRSTLLTPTIGQADQPSIPVTSFPPLVAIASAMTPKTSKRR